MEQASDRRESERRGPNFRVGQMSAMTERKDRLYLVSCVGKKGKRPVPVKELYQSTWFTLARAWVEREAAPWFILSAKHGLVQPDAVIAPYDETLNSMPVAARRDWAERVKSQLVKSLPNVGEIVIFAGRRYREYIEKPLRTHCTSVEVPMEGLRIGEQLRWLKNGPG